MLVLDGLGGIIDVKMDLGRDAFTITYDPSRVDVKAIMARVRALGYSPSRDTGSPSERSDEAGPEEQLPKRVTAALERARTTGRPLLIDFYAAWCSPCIVLETRTLRDPRVREVLKTFETLRIDTDKYLAPADYYRIVGLPTLLVLGLDGEVLYRHEGMIEPERLARELALLVGSAGQ